MSRVPRHNLIITAAREVRELREELTRVRTDEARQAIEERIVDAIERLQALRNP